VKRSECNGRILDAPCTIFGEGFHGKCHTGCRHFDWRVIGAAKVSECGKNGSFIIEGRVTR